MIPLPIRHLTLCEAEVVRAGRSIVFMQGRLRAGTRIVATADGVWKVLDGKPPPPVVNP